jgi:CRISPR system Cascade subunit CasC
MSLFIEFHLIQNFAPSSLNRDDTGAPKDAMFGGYRRARVSSQCFKRAIRRAVREQGLIEPRFQGVRTKMLKQLLEDRLAVLGRTDAESKIIAALSAAGLKLGDDGKTEYLLFLGDAEIAGFAELIDKHWDELAYAALSNEKKSKKEAKASAPAEVVKKARALLDGGKAIDVALFGRMLADLPEANQDAACQVAHAISTHRVEREFDYFTAVDDQSGPEEAGAAMIGQVEFNSATFYRYAVIDAHKLLENLKGDKNLTLLAVEAFVEAAVRAIPTGKQNTFAAHNLPTFVGTAIRHGGPLNLANAFEKPIATNRDKSLTTLSVEALTSYESQLATVYADGSDAWGYLDLTGAWPKDKGVAHADLATLAAWVKEQVALQLEA